MKRIYKLTVCLNWEKWDIDEMIEELKLKLDEDEYEDVDWDIEMYKIVGENEEETEKVLKTLEVKSYDFPELEGDCGDNGEGFWETFMYKNIEFNEDIDNEKLISVLKDLRRNLNYCEEIILVENEEDYDDGNEKYIR